MSTSLTKYSKRYLNIMRSDVANYFPKGSFLRQPNVEVNNINYQSLEYSVSQ